MLSRPEREMQDAQLNAVRAATQKDLAIAAAAASEAAMRRQAGTSMSDEDRAWYHYKGLPVPGETSIHAVGRSDPLTMALPPEAPKYLSKDVLPGFSRFNMPGIGEVILPAASSASEAIEAMENIIIQKAVLAANIAHYGPGAAKRLIDWLANHPSRQK